MKITQPARPVNLALNAPASGVIIEDPGGVFGGGPLTLEELVALLGAGTFGPYLTKTLGEGHTIQDLGVLGATATVDLANANVFLGQLAADVTITTTGWLAGGRYIRVSLTGDGVSVPTIDRVTWITPQPTAGTGVQHMTLFSDDGGTVIWGGVAGSAASSDAMVPYYIPAGQTFTVPLYKQALFTEPIDGPGTLDVIGMLIEVA